MSIRTIISTSRSLLTNQVFRFAIFGDSQNTCTSPETRIVQQRQVAWVLANRERLGVGFFLHTGDVSSGSVQTTSYIAAYKDFIPLNGVLPGIFVTGNHDETDTGATDRDTAMFNAIGSSVGYGLGDFAGNLTGLCDTGKIQNSYLELALAGRQVLVIGLEWSPRDAKVAWAKDVIEAHPGWFTVLLTHAMLYRDGTVYTRPPTNGQIWNPISYNVTPAEGINTGQDLVDKLITPYPQVKLAVCGHAYAGHAHNVITRADGSKCVCYLVDHQNLDTDAVDLRGFLSLVTVDFANGHISSAPISALGYDWVDAYAADHARHYETTFVDVDLD